MIPKSNFVTLIPRLTTWVPALALFLITGSLSAEPLTHADLEDRDGAPLLFLSGLVDASTPGHAVEVAVDLRSAKKLVLLVSPGNGDTACDHANWIEPRFTGPDGEKKLTELDWRIAHNGWRSAVKNMSVQGTPMTVDGKPVPYGIGAHSPSIIVFDIPVGYDRFQAKAGLDDSGMSDPKNAGRSAVQFAVMTDMPSSRQLEALGLRGFFGYFHARDLDDPDGARLKYLSDWVSKATPGHAVEVEADIEGAETLLLVVTPGGDGGNDHADWLEPRLTGPAGELPLTSLKWDLAYSGWRTTLTSRSVNGTPLLVMGREMTNGIGTHATSITKYTLPKGYNRFKARAALDDSGVKQGPEMEKSTVQFAVFTGIPSTRQIRLFGASGSWVRFRVESLPPGKDSLAITAHIKLHHAPWATDNFKLMPEPVRTPGLTPWIDLAKLPGKANGPLILTVPEGAKGTTQFAVLPLDSGIVREIPWDEPNGKQVIVTPGFGDILTFRDQERRYYLRTLEQTGGQVFPLARPPLFFSNAWGYTTGGAAEYMVKSFRLMGFNSVVTSEDAAKYETLYGWHSQAGQYGPPGFMPYDEDEARAQFETYYSNYFATGKGAGSAPGMRIFQLADEPGEIAIKPDAAISGFRRWLGAQGIKPGVFGKSSLDEVDLLMKDPKTPEENRRYYWSRRYQAYLTPKMFALAAEAVRKHAPSREVQSYVALSGHALYFPSKMSLDMFQLAQYPGLMPGISDWMTGGSWNWDSHQAVAFSVAPFNAGARRYGADFGKAPRSFPMMHCVNPSLFRGYTQLANQCKFISYYNYGPDYEVTEGYWSHSGLGGAVQHLNNQSAQMDDILGPGLMRPSRVAMLYSAPQEVWWPQGSFTDKRATFLALAHSYYQPELVTEEQVMDGALAHYDALVVLEQYVSRTVQDRIGEWVKGGGLLWACADALICDEYKDPYDLLERLAGLKRDHSKPLGVSVQFQPAEGETAIKEYEVPPQGRSKETIRPGVFQWAGARIRATYSDEHPAMGEKAIGKGRVVYLGHRAGLAYARGAGARGAFKWWPDGGQREVLFVPLKEANVEQELTVSGPLVMASALSTEAGTVAILYNMHHEAQTNLVVSLKEPDRPHSVQWCGWGGRLVDLPFDYADGRMVLSKFFLPGSGAMIVVRRKPAPADDRLDVMRRNAERDLGSSDWQALSAGAWFAGFFPEWQMGAKLEPLLEHEHWAVRRSAAESLGRLGDAAAGKALRRAVDKEQDSHALADEIAALALLGHRDAADLCRTLSKHPDPFRQSEAARIEKILSSKKP